MIIYQIEANCVTVIKSVERKRKADRVLGRENRNEMAEHRICCRLSLIDHETRAMPYWTYGSQPLKHNNALIRRRLLDATKWWVISIGKSNKSHANFVIKISHKNNHKFSQFKCTVHRSHLFFFFLFLIIHFNCFRLNPLDQWHSLTMLSDTPWN